MSHCSLYTEDEEVVLGYRVVWKLCCVEASVSYSVNIKMQKLLENDFYHNFNQQLPEQNHNSH